MAPMSSGNLTRDEAEQRARLLRVQSYAVSLDVTTGDETFRSSSTIEFDCAEPGGSTFVDLIAAVVDSIVFNGQELDPSAVYRDGRVHLDGLAESNTITVVADCAYSHDAEGMHHSTDPADGEVYLYTQFQPAHARQVYACFEQPDLKATWQLTVVAPARWEIVSNSPTPAPTPADGDNARWVFEPTPLLPTYLTVLVAGPYHMIRDEHRIGDQVIPLALGCRRSLVSHLDPDEFLDITKRGLDFFVERFGYPYPFAKYDQMMVPEYGGAMEHPGAVTFADSSFIYRSTATELDRELRAFVILHEMAHMWFGDLVTMRWWDDLWLNESFATYVGVLAVAESSWFTTVWSSFASLFKTGAAAQDQMPTTHPIVGDVIDLDAVWATFDQITYQKGASVLQQLVAWVGPDQFAAGVHDYLVANAWGNATAHDLLVALAAASGRDLDEWADQWLHTTGINTLRADFTLDGDGAYASFAVIQEASPDRPTLRSHRAGIGLYSTGADGTLKRTGRVELDIVGERTDVADLVGTRQPEMLLLNDGDLTFTKIRLDERSLRTAVNGIATLTDPLARVLVWSAAWDMCRDGEMAARDYIAMVLAGLDSETLTSTSEALLAQCRGAIFHYTDPAWRATGLALVAATARRNLDEVAAGHDGQVTWLRALSWSARSDADLAYLVGLLEGSESIDGLRIEGDLRWMLVVDLAAAGRLTEVDIAYEAGGDSTVSGAQHAAEARAAIPTAEAKAAAWRIIADNVETPQIQLAAATGFAYVGQAELRSRYIGDYLASVAAFMDRSERLGRGLVLTLFPDEEITESGLARIDEHLEGTAMTPTLRRLIAQGRDRIARSLRARAVDAAAESD
jgi:aminopeptidase N